MSANVGHAKNAMSVNRVVWKECGGVSECSNTRGVRPEVNKYADGKEHSGG